VNGMKNNSNDNEEYHMKISPSGWRD